MTGFLFDENLPQKIRFTPSKPIIHSYDLGESVQDTPIWNHSRENSLCIVTKDSDFSNRIMIDMPPPWVVHLRFGNLRRNEFHEFLKEVWPKIEELLPEHKLINVYLDRIEAIRG